MAGTEIASAYVSLIPSFKGGSKAIAAEFDGPAEDAGKESGESFGNGFSGAFKGLVAAGAIFGGAALFSSAFSLAMEQADLPGILQSQFGTTEAVAAASAQTAADVFAAGWGASLGEVGASVGEITRQLEQLGQTGDIDALTTSAQALAATFDEDVNGVIASASQLVKTGLAPDMQAAMDVMAAGFQAGLDPAGDFLDTITEYSVQFQNLGLDATTSFGIINQGLEAGARNSDLVADALKEFSIRATDGTAAEGFKSIGLSAEEMNAAITEGGPAARDALDTTLDRLRSIEDPAARDAAAFQIFGTQAEDLGDSLYALDPSTAAEELGDVAGAATDVAEATGGGTQSKVTELGRSFQDALAGSLVTVMPLLNGLLTILKPLAPILGPLAIAIGIITIAQWLWNAALMASPITWIILAVVALIAIIVLLVVHWDTVSAALVAAWQWIKETAATVWGAIVDFFVMIGTSIRDFFVGIWQSIVDFFVGIWQKMVEIAQGQARATLAAIEWFKELPGKVGEWFQGVYNSAKDKLSSLVDWVTGVPGMIMDALGDLGALLYNAGRDILQGLLDGIQSMWDSIQNTLGNLTDSLPDWKGPAERDRSILTPSGRMVIGGLVEGMEDEIPGVQSLLSGLTSDIAVSAPRSLADPAATGGDWNASFVIELDGQALDAKITTVSDDRNRQTRRRVLAGTGAAR